MSQAYGGTTSHFGALLYSVDFVFLDGDTLDAATITQPGVVPVRSVAPGYVVDWRGDVMDGAPASVVENSDLQIIEGQEQSIGPGGWGNFITIRHEPVDAPAFYASYLHLSAGSLPAGIAEGMPIEGGQQLGFVGNTGLRTSTHLHVHFGNELITSGDGQGYGGSSDPGSSQAANISVLASSGLGFERETVGAEPAPVFFEAWQDGLPVRSASELVTSLPFAGADGAHAEPLDFLILNLNGRFALYNRDDDEVTQTGSFGRQLTDIAQGVYGEFYATDFSRVFRVDPETEQLEQLYSLPFGSVNALTVFENNGAAQAVLAGGGRWYQMYIDTGVVIANGLLPSPYQSAGDVILLRDGDGTPTEFVFAVSRFGQDAFVRYGIDSDGVINPEDPRIDEHPISSLWGLANGRDGDAFFGFAGSEMSSFDPDTLAGQSLRNFADVNLTNISGATRVSAPRHGLLDGTEMLIQPLLPSVDSPHGTAASVMIDPATSIRNLSDLFPGLVPGPVPATVEMRGEVLNYTIRANFGGRYATAQDEDPYNGFAFTFEGLRDNPAIALRSAEVIAAGTTLEGFDDARVHHDADTVYLDFNAMSYGARARLGVQLGFDIEAQPGDGPVAGGTGPDHLRGTPGDDVFVASAGNDIYDGNGGTNTVIYAGLQADYAVQRLGDTVVVEDQRHAFVSQGRDTLQNIQQLAFADGVIRLEDLPAAEGPVTVRVDGLVQTLWGAPMQGVALSMAGANAETSASGAFELDLAPGGDGVLDAARAYDSAGDPAIRATDALEVLRLAVGLEPSFGPARPEHFIAADFNGDGRVSATDALEILRHAVSLPGAYSPEWVFVDADAMHEAGREAVRYDQGIALNALEADISVAMTGILLGSLSEVA
ncbi:peptidoglycan DD-metalloendopeptidase family protein [Rhodobacteraceae bacterium 2376]|uniref:Peptidoglycan DD-metalloendopeptidase family protein n=1 Tax=Rhabdonatronobacter sediminivivens TaxID=2743469 RepID=A0A7Z0KWS3_9RHOB|nr:peptidoglycan DD-metalloendopeptidase family protein [Rhabdonatronobacter sediminivivens]NYS23974.1 peptidoglycan DD-metalloendopeptidase family protein [Rhabdonatronobacter sediminivivens]